MLKQSPERAVLSSLFILSSIMSNKDGGDNHPGVGGGAGVYRVGSVFLRAGVNCKVQVGEVIWCLENSWVTFEYVRDVLLQPLLCNPDYPRQRGQTGRVTPLILNINNKLRIKHTLNTLIHIVEPWQQEVFAPPHPPVSLYDTFYSLLFVWWIKEWAEGDFLCCMFSEGNMPHQSEYLIPLNQYQIGLPVLSGISCEVILTFPHFHCHTCSCDAIQWPPEDTAATEFLQQAEITSTNPMFSHTQARQL